MLAQLTFNLECSQKKPFMLRLLKKLI